VGPLIVVAVSTAYLIGALATVWAVAKLAAIEER